MSQSETGNNSQQNNSNPRGMLKEKNTLLIAILVIVPFMIFFGVVLIGFQDAALLEKMTALLSGLVAAVLGYYFGQRPTQQLADQVRQTQVESQENRRDADEATDDVLLLTEQFENLKKQVDEIIETDEKNNE